jgi:ADP-heptose:LPS heptosyltransferase
VSRRRSHHPAPDGSPAPHSHPEDLAPAPPPRPRHVLVARLDNEGDVLLAGPAIRAVAAGAERVTMLCGPRGRNAATLLPGVDDVIVHRAEWIDPDPVPFDPDNSRSLVAQLRRLSPDEAIVFTSFHQSPLPLALLLRLAGVPRVGATSVDYPGSLLDVRHRIAEDVHEVERSLGLAAAMGHYPPPGDDRALHVRRIAAGDPLLRPFAEPIPYVVVHPGASASARAWSPDRHVELVSALVARGRHVAITGAPSERDLTGYIATRARGSNAVVRDLGGATSFAELAEVLAQARVLVVGNTGPAHLAAAVGTAVVSIYAPTVPAVRWRPWQVPHELLYTDVSCANCRVRICPVPGHPCIEKVPLQWVLDALERLAPAARASEAVPVR